MMGQHPRLSLNAPETRPIASPGLKDDTVLDDVGLPLLVRDELSLAYPQRMYLVERLLSIPLHEQMGSLKGVVGSFLSAPLHEHELRTVGAVVETWEWAVETSARA